MNEQGTWKKCSRYHHIVVTVLLRTTFGRTMTNPASTSLDQNVIRVCVLLHPLLARVNISTPFLCYPFNESVLCRLKQYDNTTTATAHATYRLLCMNAKTFCDYILMRATTSLWNLHTFYTLCSVIIHSVIYTTPPPLPPKTVLSFGLSPIVFVPP